MNVLLQHITKHRSTKSLQQHEVLPTTPSRPRKGTSAQLDDDCCRRILANVWTVLRKKICGTHYESRKI
ncbi:hypothetical protein JI435_409540 [Parastagonospora nodorum SN15]|uniref:Uncharacterized protein n=1 Tax=Phaeosphaeria nodorum (strain SN15 / ATCC MYA-4574 / FGSC 10173) TaxID=321614 RepID=A0A7U2HZU2_PHANO|nr:hypothetical protein JI435_409540 [Parastagonospora nodorum SN15]